MTNRTLLQSFHWYYPDGGALWKDVEDKAQALAGMVITDVWLPPAYKGASGGYSVGYDTYDLFDLGEFDQKGTVATKYGDRDALERACQSLKNNGLRVIHDVVLNHKMGADEKEQVCVRRVNEQDRLQIEDEAFEALAYTRFTFPGRRGKHSSFIWDVKCFIAVLCLQGAYAQPLIFNVIGHMHPDASPPSPPSCPRPGTAWAFRRCASPRR